MIKHVAMLLIFALAACAAARAPTPGPTAARIGQVAVVSGVQVYPVRVLEDSRCPALVRCVWAGQLRIEAVIQFRGGSEELRREIALGEAILLPEGELTLSAAIPAPVAGEAVPATGQFMTRVF